MKSFRSGKRTKGFVSAGGHMVPTEMVTRVTWDSKGCTVSIQHGEIQFTTDFTSTLNEILKHYDSEMKGLKK